MIFGAVRQFTSLLLVIVSGVICIIIAGFYLAWQVAKCTHNISPLIPKMICNNLFCCSYIYSNKKT